MSRFRLAPLPAFLAAFLACLWAFFVTSTGAIAEGATPSPPATGAVVKTSSSPTGSGAVTFAVKDVKFTHRGDGIIDIDYTIESNDSDASFQIYLNAKFSTGLTVVHGDQEIRRKITPRTLTGDGANGSIVKSGRHKITWDMKADAQKITWSMEMFPPDLSPEGISAIGISVFLLDGYLVVDLGGGPTAKNYPVRFSATGPDVSGNKCKTDELWLRQIRPATFDSLRDYGKIKVTLTEPYYVGVFEVTQRQWELVTGTNPSKYLGSTRPVEGISYGSVRGYGDGRIWPLYSDWGRIADNDSFVGNLRQKTGITFDLPTSFQWEHACRAGTDTDFNSGKNLTNKSQSQYYDENMAEVGRYYFNNAFGAKDTPVGRMVMPDGKGGYESYHTAVGSYRPNNWGLYDMHGNVFEWCLDAEFWLEDIVEMGALNPEGATLIDPVGSRRNGYQDYAPSIIRGGSWYSQAHSCAISDRQAEPRTFNDFESDIPESEVGGHDFAANGSGEFGFRLAAFPADDVDLVSAGMVAWAKPTQSVNPTDPADPTDPTKPENPGNTIDPKDPMYPSKHDASSIAPDELVGEWYFSWLLSAVQSEKNLGNSPLRYDESSRVECNEVNGEKIFCLNVGEYFVFPLGNLLTETQKSSAIGKKVFTSKTLDSGGRKTYVQLVKIDKDTWLLNRIDCSNPTMWDVAGVCGVLTRNKLPELDISKWKGRFAELYIDLTLYGNTERSTSKESNFCDGGNDETYSCDIGKMSAETYYRYDHPLDRHLISSYYLYDFEDKLLSLKNVSWEEHKYSRYDYMYSESGSHSDTKTDVRNDITWSAIQWSGVSFKLDGDRLRDEDKHYPAIALPISGGRFVILRHYSGGEGASFGWPYAIYDWTFSAEKFVLTPLDTPVNQGIAVEEAELIKEGIKTEDETLSFVAGGKVTITPSENGLGGDPETVAYVYTKTGESTATITLKPEGREEEIIYLDFAAGSYKRNGKYVPFSVGDKPQDGALPDDPWENPAISVLANSGQKLVAPKTMVVPGKTSLAPGTKAVYVWTRTDEHGNTSVVTDAKGKPVTGNTFTAKASGVYEVRLEYTPYDKGTKTVYPKVVTPSHKFYEENDSKMILVQAVLKLAKENGFVMEALHGAGTAVKNGVVRGESMRFTVNVDTATTSLPGTVHGPYNYRWYEGKVHQANLRRETLNTYSTSDSVLVEFSGEKANGWLCVVETVARDPNPKKSTKPLATVTTKTLKPTLILPPHALTLTAKPAHDKGNADGGRVDFVENPKNSTLTLTASAKGTGKLYYRWYRGSVSPENALYNSPKGATADIISGAGTAAKPASATAKLTIKKITRAAAGLYICEVTSEKAIGYSEQIQVTVAYNGSSSALKASATGALADANANVSNGVFELPPAE